MKRLGAYVDFCGLSCKPRTEVSGSNKLVFYRPTMKTKRDYRIQLHLGGTIWMFELLSHNGHNFDILTFRPSRFSDIA